MKIGTGEELTISKTVKYFWQKYEKNLPPANEYNQASECQSHYKKTKCQIEI